MESCSRYRTSNKKSTIFVLLHPLSCTKKCKEAKNSAFFEKKVAFPANNVYKQEVKHKKKVLPRYKRFRSLCRVSRNGFKTFYDHLNFRGTSHAQRKSNISRHASLQAAKHLRHTVTFPDI